MCFCFFGDGAFGEGAVHESLNLASVWCLPVVLVCENNAAQRDGQANDYQSASSLLAIAEVHGVPGCAVDARHPGAVLESLESLTEAVRAGRGPRFLDAQAGSWPGNATFFPHDATGPTDLRDAEAPVDDQWRSVDDPLLNECRRLLAENVPMASMLRLDDTVRAEVDKAVRRAHAAPVPCPEVAFADVCAR